MLYFLRLYEARKNAPSPCSGRPFVLKLTTIGNEAGWADKGVGAVLWDSAGTSPGGVAFYGRSRPRETAFIGGKGRSAGECRESDALGEP